jgi:putative Mg2+ transporter-C (MgtC) family protein
MFAELLQAQDVVMRLAFSVVIGAGIGVNRWLRHKPAGFGTHGLVALGSTIATLLIIRAPGSDAEALSRVIQGLVTGVGFIGAGVIMRENANGEVHGLTTAASIWASAILGIGCGVADFVLSAAGAIFALGILVLSKPFEDLIGRLFKRNSGANGNGRY